MNWSKAGCSAFSSLASLFRLFVLMMGILTGHEGVSQGWEITLGGNKYDEGRAIAETVDGGFLMAGFSESFGTDNDLDILIVRTDIDGNVLWNRVYDEGFEELAFGLLAEPDGTFLVVGSYAEKPSDPKNVLLMKLSKEGNPLWIRHYPSADREVGNSIAKDNDGGYVIIGTTTTTDGREDDALLIKVDETGNEQWRKTYHTVGDDLGASVVVLEDGYSFISNSDNPVGFDSDIILYKVDKNGEISWRRRYYTEEADIGNALIETRDRGLAVAGLSGDNSDALLLKFDFRGELLWEKTTGGELGDLAYHLTELADGSLVITGQYESSASNPDILVAQFDKDGNQQWLSVLGEEGFVEEGRAIVRTRDGNFAIAGSKSPFLYDLLNDMALVRTDGQGNIITNVITGHVFNDVSNGCEGYNLTEDIPLKDWLIEVSNDRRTYYGTSDENGGFQIRVDTGDYNVRVLPVNAYWRSCVEAGYEVSITEFYDTLTLDFPQLDETVCPYLEVDVSTPFLAACSDIEYRVAYCNIGTGTAEGAYVEITLDDKLTFVSSSIPVAAQEGNVYTFDLGDISSTDCGSFSLQTQMACSGIADGQAALVSAQIYPDTLCVEPDPAWDGSSLTVEGRCNEDKEIEFWAANVGAGDMQEPQQAIVVEDNIIFFRDSVTLSSGERELLGGRELIPRDGATYRAILEQVPFHPGRSYPTAFVEGCVEEGNPFSTGMVTMFPENDLDPTVSIEVQEIVGSINSVELRGYPKGYGDSSLIATNTDVTYTLLFRNIGTDTIDRVVIRDTLSSQLDISTVRPGASNFPYDFEVYDNGILKFTFSDIELLPGGSDGDTGSYGFAKFRVSQKPDNPVGTVIQNRAAVFFNYLEPVITNSVRYFVGEFPSYITTDTEKVFWPGVKINVYPNPFIESAVFEVEGVEFKSLTLNVFDTSGRLLHTNRYNGNKFMYYRNHLPPGLYVYRLETEGKLISSGKLLVR